MEVHRIKLFIVVWNIFSFAIDVLIWYCTELLFPVDTDPESKLVHYIGLSSRVSEPSCFGAAPGIFFLELAPAVAPAPYFLKKILKC